MQKLGIETRSHFFEVEIESFKNFEEMHTIRIRERRSHAIK